MSERQTEPDDALLARYLADRDVPCPRCAYNLHALRGAQCPECGLSLQLAVNPAEPILLLWSAALVEASLGAGIGLMFIALILGKAGMPRVEWYWIIAIAWACIPVAAAIALQRRRILRWSQHAQWGLVAAIGVVLVILVAGIGAIVR